MPINHRVHFTKQCSDDPAARLRTPGCAVREKPFQPHSRTSNEVHENLTPQDDNVNLVSKFSPKPVIETDNKNENENENENKNDDSDTDTDNSAMSNQNQKKIKMKMYIHRMKTNLKANTESLSVEERAKAQMTRASTTAYKKGFDLAQEQLDSSLEESTRGWKIDQELSTKEGLVLTKGNQIRVAYRGTDLKNIHDLATDAAAFAGVEQVAPQMRSSKAQIEDIQRKYNRLPDELLGYSKGGAHALAMGDEFKIPSTTFNPLIGRKQVLSKSEVPHTVIRTVEDFASTPLIMTQHKTNYTVKSLNPIRGFGDPKSVHDLKQFTSGGPRQPGESHNLEVERNRMSQELANYMTLHDFKSGVEQGKTFTQTLDEFNTTNGTPQRVDVLEDGSLGPRINKNSPTVKYWEDSGGTFTESERAHLDVTPTSTSVVPDEARAMGLGEELTSDQRQIVGNMSTEERTSFLKNKNEALESHQDLMESHGVEPHRTVMAEVFKPTSVMTGFASGAAAHVVMDKVDPHHKLNPVVSEGTEGAIAGGIGSGMAAAVGASTAFAPEVAAGASAYIAGIESQRAITAALQKDHVSNEAATYIGAGAGGAIGGATAAAVGTGAVIGGSMLAGAEAGEAIGVVGGPVGMAVGAAGGTLLGATIGLGTAAYQDIVGKKNTNQVKISPARQEQLKLEAERAAISEAKAPYVKEVTAEAQKWDMQGYLHNLIDRRSNLYKAVGDFKFMDATPEIGTNVYDRQLWYMSHKKPYLNDPDFQKLSPQNTGYVLANEEQIQYIRNNLDYQKTVAGSPATELNLNLYLDTKRLGAEPGYQNMDDDTFWLDKKQLGVTHLHFNETENKNDSTVPV